MSRGNPIPTAVRRGVDQREQGRCLRCGSKGREVHHRQRRREGGHSLANCILLCGACHRWAHAHPADSRPAGFIVSVYAESIEQTPINAYYGWVLLSDAGSIQWSVKNLPAAEPTP